MSTHEGNRSRPRIPDPGAEASAGDIGAAVVPDTDGVVAWPGSGVGLHFIAVDLNTCPVAVHALPTLANRRGRGRDRRGAAHISRRVSVQKEKLMDRARDELFSHINRCGVLQASADDQKVWMEETIDYLAERYPDLDDPDLDQLHMVGLRFCQPALEHGSSDTAKVRDGVGAA